MDAVKVVVRYADGQVIKGYTQDFFPNKDRFHLQPQQKSSGQDTQQILVKISRRSSSSETLAATPRMTNAASLAMRISRRGGRWRSSSKTAKNLLVQHLDTSQTARASLFILPMTRATTSVSMWSRPSWTRSATCSCFTLGSGKMAGPSYRISLIISVSRDEESKKTSNLLPVVRCGIICDNLNAISII